MKKILLLAILALFFVSLNANAQTTTTTLDKGKVVETKKDMKVESVTVKEVKTSPTGTVTQSAVTTTTITEPATKVAPTTHKKVVRHKPKPVIKIGDPAQTDQKK